VAKHCQYIVYTVLTVYDILRYCHVMKVATYSRVSTSHHGQNPDVQVHDLRRYCEARSWTIAHEVVDHGFSGGTDVRPGLRRLLGLVRAREVDIVVVVKMDRLFRSLKHLVTTLEEFQAIGVQFIAVRDNVDYSTPGGRLFVQMLGSLAEFEKSLLRERTMMGLAHARAQGKRLGRPQKHDPEAIRRLRSRGLSYRQIVKRLGVPMGTITSALKDTAHQTPSKAAPESSGISRGRRL
jgi:DNA invertase Pin-like site-specific DNA recombinase